MRMCPAVLSLVLLTLASGAVDAQAQDAASQRGDGGAIIFFAWDRPIIDGDAAARLDDVAASILSQPGARIELAGHADRSGPAGPNLSASRKRAEAVQAYLAGRGIPSSAMRIVSYGETRPLIPTADGVREPQNRRVEIVVTRAPGG